MVKHKKRCAGCLRLYSVKKDICPYCNMDDTDTPIQKYIQALPYNTVIANLRFGHAVSLTEDEIVYMGMNLVTGKAVWIHEFFWHGYMERQLDSTLTMNITDTLENNGILREIQEKYEKRLFSFIKKYPVHIETSGSVYGVLNRYSFRKPKVKHINQSYATHSIQGSREKQEDAADVVCFPNGFFAILCDGMGGMQGGDIASNRTVDKLKEIASILYYCDEAVIYDLLIKQIKVADFIVHKLTDDEGREIKCGSTLVTMIVRGNHVWFASVGDSHIYHIHNNTLTLLTEEHIHLTDLLKQAESGKISYNEAYNNPKRSALTSYIGIGNSIKIQLADINLKSGDRLLLCSDGVYKVLNDMEILSEVNSDVPVNQGTERLIQCVKAKKTLNQDNTTCILYQYSQKGKKEK